MRRRLPALLLLGVLVMAVQAAACRKTSSDRGTEEVARPTPGYTPASIPPTPTLRPGEPTPLPELPE